MGTNTSPVKWLRSKVNSQGTSQRSLAVLLGIMVAGLVLRAYRVGFQCLWTEEQYTATIAAEPFSRIISLSLLGDHNPPLYYLVAHASQVVFGVSDVALRLPSVVFGMLAIPAIYLAGRDFKDEMTGLLSAGFLAVLYPFVYYSQYARAYSMEIFFFICLLWVFIRIRKGDRHRATFMAFGILSGITIWTHLFAVVPVSLMLADLLIFEKPQQALTAAGVAVLTVSPLLVMAGGLVGRRLFTSPSGATLGYGLGPLMMIIATPVEFFSTTFPLMSGLVVMGLGQKDHPVFELLAITLLTVGAGVVCSAFTPFYPRYYLAVATVLILLVASPLASAVDWIFKNEWLKMLAIADITGLWLLLQLNQYGAYFLYQKYVC